MRLNFAVGLLAGVLFASAILVAAGVSQGTVVWGPALGKSAPAQDTASTTTVTAALSSTTSLALTPPNASSLLTNRTQAASGAGNMTAGTSSVGTTPVFSTSESASHSPSSLSSIINQPTNASLLLLPILVAFLLGFGLYRASTQKQE